MSKKIKIALLFCLTVCVAVFAFVFTACGDGEESGYNGTYTFTLVDEDGNAVEGITIQFCTDQCVPKTSDENGVVVYEWDEPVVAHVQYVTDSQNRGYTFAEFETTTTQFSYTIELVKAN